MEVSKVEEQDMQVCGDLINAIMQNSTFELKGQKLGKTWNSILWLTKLSNNMIEAYNNEKNKTQGMENIKITPPPVKTTAKRKKKK